MYTFALFLFYCVFQFNPELPIQPAVVPHPYQTLKKQSM